MSQIDSIDGIVIKKYTPANEYEVFALLDQGGDELSGYWRGLDRERFQKALASSITYLIYDSSVLGGLLRCRDDDGLGIFVYDLLVDKRYRGKGYGRLLIDFAAKDYPSGPIYLGNLLKQFRMLNAGSDKASSNIR